MCSTVDLDYVIEPSWLPKLTALEQECLKLLKSTMHFGLTDPDTVSDKSEVPQD